MNDLSRVSTDTLIAIRVRAKTAIAVLLKKRPATTVSDERELKSWRLMHRRLNAELKKRLVQLPLF